MGRSKRLYPTGKFFLKVPKIIDKGALYPIYIQYTWNRKVITKQTGLSCRLSDWNPNGNNNKGQLKSSYGADYNRANNQLQSLLSKYDGLFFQYVQNNPNRLNSNVVRSILRDEPVTRKDKGTDFLEYGKRVLESEYSRNIIGISVYQNGLSSLKTFSEFLVVKNLNTVGNSIYIGDVTTHVIDELIKYRRNVKSNSDETINHALTPIIKTIRSAAEEGLCEKEIAYKIGKMKINVKPKLDENDGEDVERHLTPEQLEQLKRYYHGCREQRRKEFIEMFFFCYYACGLRCVDMMTLSWDNIDLAQRELKKLQVKTRTRQNIPLNDQAEEILNRWKGKHERFVFGLLCDDFQLNNQKALYKRRNSVTQSINQSLKVVGEELELPFNLTMHVARHSFAVFALNSGLSISVVSRLLGHNSTGITEQVYAKYLPQTLADEVAKLKFESLL